MTKRVRTKPTRHLDADRIDDAVLALMVLGIHDGVGRAWKGFDWAAMDRLHGKGYISDPKSKAKSVVFTESGLEHAQALFDAMFTTPNDTESS